MCCGVSDWTTESNSSQWWVIFIRLPCGNPVGSPGLCWGVSCSIACSALVEIFQGLAGPQGIFLGGVKRIGLGETHSSKVEITLVS